MTSESETNFFIVPDSADEILKVENEIESQFLLEGYDPAKASVPPANEKGKAVIYRRAEARMLPLVSAANFFVTNSSLLSFLSREVVCSNSLLYHQQDCLLAACTALVLPLRVESRIL